MMRGYRKLRSEDKLDTIASIKDQFAATTFPGFQERNLRFLLGAGASQARLILTQLLLLRFAGVAFNRSMLVAVCPGGSFSSPLPSEWREVLRKNGIPVNELKCSFAWTRYVAANLLRGVVQAAIIFLRSLREVCQRPADKSPGRVFFHDMTPANLPSAIATRGNARNIFAWYARWLDRRADLASLEHDVGGVSERLVEGIPVRSGKSFPVPDTSMGIIAYVKWSIGAIIMVLQDLVCGRWHSAILLQEASKAASVRFVDAGALPAENFFHNSSWLYRPLWTYEAESKGSKTVFYFYSTNAESFKQASGYVRQENLWQATNWPRYMVWDEWQKAFLQRVTVNNADIEVVGSIDFSDSGESCLDVAPDAIALFDVQPMRKSIYESLGIGNEYYVAETADGFLRDVSETASDLGIPIVFKRKRDVGKSVHPRYRNLVAELALTPGFHSIDPAINARNLIIRSRMVISMPFTSTALLGREMGKPSCYYDSTGRVQRDDRAAHGIPVVLGRTELSGWMQTVSCAKRG